MSKIWHDPEEFRALPSIRQCYHCQGFGHSAQNCSKQPVCLICGESQSRKECTKTQPKCGNCKGPHVASYKGYPYYKSQAFRQHVVSSQNASVLKSFPPQNTPSMSFSAEKLIEFVTTVVVKTAQPQLCYSNLSKGAIEKKSNVCKEISEVAQKILGVDIKGETLFKAIPSVGTAPAPTPFSFTPKEASAKPKTSAPNASTVLENIKSSTTKPSNTRTGTKTLTANKTEHTTSKTHPQPNLNHSWHHPNHHHHKLLQRPNPIE